ncbi:hypothetical protein DQW50_16505 [Halorubrum sp. 48-1-W]|uniref:cold shock domain-containing protein n=1 Tax=Halorubrum sp. 48-1-W TaxID=2249761 RepID=UPI000DCF0C5B|nr:cold shock domain-containing protein [Halorubrum sp. 48-1-W]RAW44055.1 hypothetical protein DQW50_16505 [Halorubrum sp. 48-1-W]
MALQYDGEDRITNSNRTDYQVGHRFQTVLSTLPDSSVPEAVALLGILTGVLTPIDVDTTDHRETAEAISDPPSAEVPIETVKSILWLLGEIRESIDDERKQKIGTLLSKSGLNSPGEVDNKSDQSTDINDNDNSTNFHRSTTDTDDVTDNEDDVGDGDDDLSDDADDNEDDVGNSGDNYECEFCDQPFAVESALMSHLTSCVRRPNGAQYGCDQCNNAYSSQYALDRHVEDDHNNETAHNSLYHCSHCGSEFDSHTDLLRHKIVHTNQSVADSTTNDSSDSTSKHEPNDGLVARNDTGVVANFLSEERYGFISTSEVEDDVFFHVSEFSGELPVEGDSVQYDIYGTDQGFEARNVGHNQRKEPSDDPFASTRTRWGDD